jgi:hypothetical protein
MLQSAILLPLGQYTLKSCVQLQNQSHVSVYRYFNVLYSGWYGQKVKIMKFCCCCFFCYYVYVSISKPPVCEIVTSLSDTPVCEIVMKSITDVQVCEFFLWSPFRTRWNARLLRCFFRTCRYMRLLWTYRLVTVSFSDMQFCEIVISLLDMVLRESVLLSISDMCVCISRLNASRCRWCCNIWLCTCKWVGRVAQSV